MKKLKEKNIPRTTLENLIEEYLYTEKEKTFFREKVFDDLTFEEIAEKHFISVQRAKEIVYGSRDKIINAYEMRTTTH